MTALEKQAIIERRNYQNEWRRKNKEKVQQYNKQYWERRAMKVGEKHDTTTNENN